MRANYRTNATPLFRVLSDDQIEDIYLAALAGARAHGTRVYSDEARALLREAGCQVESDGRARSPPGWLRAVWEPRRSASRSPAAIAEADHAGVQQGLLSAPALTARFLLDPYTDERRRYTFADVYHAAKLAEALPNIDFHMSLGLTSDVPMKAYDRHQLLAMLKGTTKPLCHYCC